MSTVMSRRTMLRTTVAAAGVALAGASGFTTAARAATSRTTARVGATVNPRAYGAGTTWDQAMARFNTDVGRDFEVAKRYFQGPANWPTEHDLGVQIQSLIDRRCRGLLCFKPAVDGSDLTALVSSLTAVKAKLTDVKVTLYQEQGLEEKLSAAEFKQVYEKYSEAVSAIFPLFVDFAGARPDTWAAYRPTRVQGIAVDFYADAWVRQTATNSDPLGVLARWADEAGQELGIWEIGNTAAPTLPTRDQVQGTSATSPRCRASGWPPGTWSATWPGTTARMTAATSTRSPAPS
jgi:hypothetical protein